MNDSAALWADEEAKEQVLLEPRLNTELYGHEEVEKLLLKDIENDRLPHAIILSGKSGIGKRTLAFRLARYLLADIETGGGLFGDDAPATNLFVEAGNSVAKLIASSGHMDLKYIEPSFEDEKGKKLATRIIRVYLSRKVPDFLSQTAAEGGWRIVIIDEAELMNTKAQNAMLKIIEEPPKKTILILVTSKIGSMLPTIHSRCRVIPMQDLSDENMLKLLKKTEIPTIEHKKLLKISEGSIGYALELFENGGLEMIEQIQSLFNGLSEIEKYQIAQKISGKAKDYPLFMEMLIEFLAKMVKLSATEKTVGYEKILSRHSKQEWLDIWEKARNDYMRGQIGNLDKQTIMIQIINRLG